MTVDLLVKYSSQKKNQKDLVDFWCRKNDFESTSFAYLEEVVHDFGRSDDDMILWKKYYFQYMQTWFDTQLDQKILDGI